MNVGYRGDECQFNENHEIILECLGDDYEEFYD